MPFERDGQHYMLIDTAGVRRRARVHETIEKFSVVKTLQAIDRGADVVIGVLDAHESIAEQDASLLGLVAEQGRALVIAVNKWDGIAPRPARGDPRRARPAARFPAFAPVQFISARHGTGVGELMVSVQVGLSRGHARDADAGTDARARGRPSTMHQPPLVRGRRIKLRYAHQGGRNPPVVVIHGNQTRARARRLPPLSRKPFPRAVPAQGHAACGSNSGPTRIPIAGRRNALTPRQRSKRKRLVRNQGRASAEAVPGTASGLDNRGF